MCRRVECSKCGRPTFAGCGAHVEQVLRDVPVEDRCRCEEEKHVKKRHRDEADDRPWLWKLLTPR